MIGFLTPFADDGIGLAFGFVFMGTNIAAALLVYFFLYESVGLSLEAVDKMYGVEGLKVSLFACASARAAAMTAFGTHSHGSPRPISHLVTSHASNVTSLNGRIVTEMTPLLWKVAAHSKA